METQQTEFNAYVTKELQDADKRMDKLVEDMAELREALTQNAVLLQENVRAVAAIKSDTADLLTAFESWRGAMRVLDAIGKLAKPLGYIVGFGASVAALWATIKSGVNPK
jgi:hypothetical protein